MVLRRVVVVLLATGLFTFPAACQKKTTRETTVKVEGPQKEHEIKVKTTEKGDRD